jgi:prepilin-type N-terminal cleavage/methylation domain-containing protein
MSILGQQRRGKQEGVTLIELLISMTILGIATAMLIGAWVNLQQTYTLVVRTNNARASVRDAMSRISGELRGAQPTALPTPSGTTMPASETPLTWAGPTEVRFNSAFNSSGANADGSGVSALRPTRIWLDVDAVQPSPWNAQCKTLYWQRDFNGNGSFVDADDRSIVLARNVANENVGDTTNGTAYTAVFRYAYRDPDGGVLWTDNADSSLDLTSVVAIGVRLIVNRNDGGKPAYVDLTTTVRLRNASVD